ncbi:hypothetical protein DFAR_770003 [Desulfarculales bacterium]
MRYHIIRGTLDAVGVQDRRQDDLSTGPSALNSIELPGRAEPMSRGRLGGRSTGH